MPQGHEVRFMGKLEKELPVKKSNSFFFLKIAAALLVMLGLGYGIATGISTDTIDPQVVEVEGKKNQIKSLGDISPDLKKVENYYLASINMELAKNDLHSRKYGVDRWLFKTSE